MTATVIPISLPFVLNFTVNCYLVPAENGFVLFDTGPTGQRSAVERKLTEAGCRPGDLKLIALTHGDFDHCGNAAYLREAFGAPVALHPDDDGMVEQGDMYSGRQQPNPITRALTGLFARLPEGDRFTPDVHLEEGDDLTGYGLDATVIHIPGHSSGSIGYLTAGSDLIGGDLLGNVREPQLWSIMDDLDAAHASVRKLTGYDIRTIHPGHGQPITAEQLAAIAAAL
jgi:hydroxyacylglutathione hydrolase